VNFWATNGWINYTRTFPAGNYYLYARLSAGNGAFNLQCAKVTSGAGTTTQTTSYVGTFTGSGTSFNTWQYVPLVNTNISSTVPVAVSLAGLTTLQLTGDFNEDVNFFALVPIITPVQISASISGPNIVLSFPTQNGVTYSVYYKNDLSDPTWSFLTSVSGDGSVKSVNDPKNLAHRFYRLTLQ